MYAIEYHQVDYQAISKCVYTSKKDTKEEEVPNRVNIGVNAALGGLREDAYENEFFNVCKNFNGSRQVIK